MTEEGRERVRNPRAAGRGEDPRVYEALGRAIKAARTERGIERKELAAATGLSYAYLSDIESGRRRPSSGAIFEISRALEMNPSDLMLRTEELTNRIASEELAEEAALARAAAEPPAGMGFVAPDSIASPRRRRSWFEGSLASLERMTMEATGRMKIPPGPQTTERASVRAELNRVLEKLGPEDLELVLELTARLAREAPRRLP